MSEFFEENFSGIDAGISPNIPTDEIETDHMFLMSVVRDRSISMDPHRSVMTKSTQEFVRSIQDSKSDDEMLISLTEFNSQINSYGFQNVADMPTSYHPDGMTALYDAIIVAQERLYDGKGGGYMEELNAAGTKPRGAMVIFSDGEDTCSRKSASDARKSIELLKSREILVAFVAFGSGAKGIAQQLGIDPQNVLETAATASEMRRIWGILSKSAISMSKSAASGNSQDAFFDI